MWMMSYARLCESWWRTLIMTYAHVHDDEPRVNCDCRHGRTPVEVYWRTRGHVAGVRWREWCERSELSTGHFSWTRPDPTRRNVDPTRDCRQKVWPDPTHPLPHIDYVHEFNMQVANREQYTAIVEWFRGKLWKYRIWILILNKYLFIKYLIII